MLPLIVLLCLFVYCSALPQNPSQTSTPTDGQLNASVYGSPHEKDISPQCVNTHSHNEWSTWDARLDVDTCLIALSKLQYDAGPDTMTEKLFWSRKIFKEAENLHLKGTKVALPYGGPNCESIPPTQCQTAHYYFQCLAKVGVLQSHAFAVTSTCMHFHGDLYIHRGRTPLVQDLHSHIRKVLGETSS